MIGIFDSGIGGLTFLKEVKQLLPGYDYMYLGDTARVPYGPRSPETIQKYTEQGVQFLLEKKCELIIIACNIMSAVALRQLQQKYTSHKLLGVLIPGAEQAVAATKNNRIGIAATLGTVNSGSYEKEIKKLKPDAVVYQQACPLLVPLIEEGLLDQSPITRKFVKNYTRHFKDVHIDTLVLGSTHYPLIEKTFREIAGKRVTVINSSRAAAEALVPYLKRHPEIERKLSRKGKTYFYFTEPSERTKKIGEKFLRSPIQTMEKAVLE